MQSISPDYKARKQGQPTMPLKERLYSKIKVNEYTGCWEWQGTLRNGYGRMIVGSRTDGTRRSESAHRVSYMLNYGEIPRVLCYNFNPQKEQHKKLGDRELLDIWAEIRVTQNAGFGNRADVIICAFVDGQQEYEKALRAAKTCKEKK